MSAEDVGNVGEASTVGDARDVQAFQVDRMRVRVLPTSAEVAVAAADRYERLLRAKPAAVLGLATGSTPSGLYDELARRHREEGLSFADAQGFLLDEYLGLPVDHPERYRNVIRRELADRVGLPDHSVHAPPVDGDDLEARCTAYDAAIAAAGGIDLQVLGLGADGHIAFNMPGTDFAATTRVTELSEQTVRDNARFFGGDVAAVPRRAASQGLATIMRARAILLIVTGAHKAAALRDLVHGPVTPALPATVLRAHDSVDVLVDGPAATLLEPRGA